MANYGYYVDLRGVTFGEGVAKTWIMAMRAGEYQHPGYGKINLTFDRIKRFADSVKQRVRGIDLDIDYDHKADPARGNEAAGWVQDAKVEGDALMLLVEWTKTAAEKIKEGAYRYFSPEFHDEWTDASGTKHQDVLFGGGITNRPFLKNLLPVNLSELTFAETKNEGNSMDPKKLRAALGLPEDATDDQVLAAAESNRQAATTKGDPVDRTATTHAPNNAATDKQPLVDGKPLDATTAGSVDKDGNMVTPDNFELSELAKTNPLVKIMLAEREANNKRLAELENAHKLSEIKVKLNEYRTGDTVVAPAILDEASKLLIALPAQFHGAVHTMLAEVQKLGEKGSVKLGETPVGSGTADRGAMKLAEDRVEEAVTKLLNEAKTAGNTKYTKADAYVDAMAADPKLFSEYQSAAYAFKA